MTAPPLAAHGSRLLRIAALALLVAAPLALGSVHEPAYIPLLIALYAVGLGSWGLGHWARAHGVLVSAVPGARLLLALHGVVLLQLLPLPPGLLRLLSPGSFAFYDDPSLVPLTQWRPITVSPADTLRGLLFLGAMSLLYAAVFREFAAGRWRHILAGSVVATGLFMTVEALLMASLGERRIYGLWRPSYDYAVFGPYVNRNHFAGYEVMATLLGLAFAAAAVRELGHHWRRRRRGWLVLGEPQGSAALGLMVVAMTLVAGLWAAQSRGGVSAFVVATLVLAAVYRQRGPVLVVAVLAVLGVTWVGVEGLVHGFESRGLRSSRLDAWSDVVGMVPRFPVLGTGLNAFASAYPAYQTASKGEWWEHVDNEYLQALVELGVVGAALVAVVLVVLFRGAWRGAARGALGAGLLAALVGAACHNLVECNWQIEANAATFAALAGLALRGAEEIGVGPLDVPAG